MTTKDAPLTTNDAPASPEPASLLSPEQQALVASVPGRRHDPSSWPGRGCSAPT